MVFSNSGMGPAKAAELVMAGNAALIVGRTVREEAAAGIAAALVGRRNAMLDELTDFVSNTSPLLAELSRKSVSPTVAPAMFRSVVVPPPDMATMPAALTLERFPIKLVHTLRL